MSFDVARVRRLRESAGLNQREAAELAGLSQPTWQRIESGEREPKLGEVVGMAAALGCLTSTILGNGVGSRSATAMRKSQPNVDAAQVAEVAEDLAFVLETEAALYELGYTS